MATIEIPTRSDLPYWTEIVTLDSVVFELVFWWNTRDSRWYLDINDSAGAALVAGVPLVVDFSLLRQHVAETLPAGTLIASDTTGQGQEIEAIEDLGSRVRLLYIEAS